MQNTSLNRIAMCALLAFGLSANAQQAAKTTTAKGGDQKVDISDLENKYWAPKDTDFSVVQNRTYTKAGRWFITPSVGLLVNDSYSKGAIYGLTANYFLTERHGFQLSYQRADLGNNDATSAFASEASGVAPNRNAMNQFIGLGYSFVPFYAKMSFLGKRVMYFDMAITPVIGATNYRQFVQSGNQDQTAFSYGFDVTQYFFINKWFAFRLDLDNHWTNENKLVYFGTTAPGLTGTGLGSYNNLDTTFTFGFTFYY